MSNRAASGVRIRPGNFGYVNYVDSLFQMGCFEDIVRLRLFPSAKDVSESMGALQAAATFMNATPAGRTCIPIPTEGGPASVSVPALEKKVTASRARWRAPGVLMLAVGDGSTPQTAGLASFLTK